MDARLFSWTDGRVVLFVERGAHGWTISRGWITGDELKDVRRWSFDSRRRLVGQIRRLVRESTGDHLRADEAAERLALWLESEPLNDDIAG